jgi:hypothetical protein
VGLVDQHRQQAAFRRQLAKVSERFAKLSPDDRAALRNFGLGHPVRYPSLQILKKAKLIEERDGVHSLTATGTLICGLLLDTTRGAKLDKHPLSPEHRLVASAQDPASAGSA